MTPTLKKPAFEIYRNISIKLNLLSEFLQGDSCVKKQIYRNQNQQINNEAI